MAGKELTKVGKNVKQKNIYHKRAGHSWKALIDYVFCWWRLPTKKREKLIKR